MSNVKFSVDYAKRATSNCKKCKQRLEKESLRLAKVVPNPFSESADEMKQYFHAKCLFDSFLNARATTKIIESAEDVENWADLKQIDKDDILKMIAAIEEKRGSKMKATDKPKMAASPRKSPQKKTNATDEKGAIQKTLEDVFIVKPTKSADASAEDSDDEKTEEREKTPELNQDINETHPDNSLFQFEKLCVRIGNVNSYTQKTETLKTFIESGSTESNTYKGDMYVLIKLLLPGVVKRVYNVNSKQLVKHFSQIFGVGHAEMLDHFNSGGDISETVEKYFKTSKHHSPCVKSSLTLHDVDRWLEELTKFTKEEDQQRHLEKITKKCTTKDLLTVIRLIKHDLRINAGPKHILSALDENAYAAFQASRDLKNVIAKIQQRATAPGISKNLSISIQLKTPVLPMLAEACRSVEAAMKKCPNGMFAEVKYDGERVQVHKHGSDFIYYSRSLKPVQPHKVEHFKNFIPQAFPGGGDMILDAEVLLVDTNTSKPLPFGTLGVHKKNKFSDANVCLFVFDCLLYQSKSLMDKPLVERKDILEKNMQPIPNRIMISEFEVVKHGDKQKLQGMINRAIKDGLEGLVLKDMKSIYEPGKRHWLKVKKDYLKEGTMADSADLIVLGAFYGTGNKGGLMSVFLMGCYDAKRNKFCTVTKCGNGHDDATIEKINKQLKNEVDKISKNYDKLPDWLLCNRQLVPDFVVKDPKKAPVWEIAGAEFSASDVHTADGISIRFPRVTKIRDDKTWKTATNLAELKVLYDTSKERSDFVQDDEEKIAVNEEEEGEGSKVVPKHSLTKMLDKWDEGQEDNSSDNAESSSKSTPIKSPGSTISKSPEKSPVKRRIVEDSDEDEPISKKTCREACKYGAKCYQKNADHKKAFWHPGDKDEKCASDNDAVQDINDEEFLNGFQFYLPADLEKRKDLLRQIYFYAGEVVDDIENASHVVTTEKVDERYNAKIVSPDWIWNCIKKRKIG